MTVNYTARYNQWHNGAVLCVAVVGVVAQFADDTHCQTLSRSALSHCREWRQRSGYTCCTWQIESL